MLSGGIIETQFGELMMSARNETPTPPVEDEEGNSNFFSVLIFWETAKVTFSVLKILNESTGICFSPSEIVSGDCFHVLPVFVDMVTCQHIVAYYLINHFKSHFRHFSDFEKVVLLSESIFVFRVVTFVCTR